jgi:hypothetical protein
VKQNSFEVVMKILILDLFFLISVPCFGNLGKKKKTLSQKEREK